jgi:hypothetical protein
MLLETPIDGSKHDEPLLTQQELAPFIRAETGIPLSHSTITKLCSPAIGDGPAVATWFGRRPLYARDAVLAWARARLSAERCRTAHNWPEKVLERQEERKATRRAKAAKPKAGKPRQ